MTTAAADGHGPVDFVLIEFPHSAPREGAARALLDLVEAGVVRLYDLVLLRKEDDGSATTTEVTDPTVASFLRSPAPARDCSATTTSRRPPPRWSRVRRPP